MIFHKPRIIHYNSIMKPDELYGSEYLKLNKKRELHELEKEKILRNILGAQKTAGDAWKKTKNKELNKYSEKILESISRKRDIRRMDKNRLSKKKSKYIVGLKANNEMGGESEE